MTVEGKPQDGNETPAPEATPIPAPQDGNGKDALAIEQAKKLEAVGLEKKARKRAQEAEKALELANAKLQEIADKDKSEVDKANAKAAKLEQELAHERTQSADTNRRMVVLRQGVQSQYVKYVASELKEAQASEDFEAEKWFGDLKKSSPVFFGEKTAAPGSGEGGASLAGQGDKAAQLQAIKQKITELLPHRKDEKVEFEIMNLSAKAERIIKELKGRREKEHDQWLRHPNLQLLPRARLLAFPRIMPIGFIISPRGKLS